MASRVGEFEVTVKQVADSMLPRRLSELIVVPTPVSEQRRVPYADLTTTVIRLYHTRKTNLSHDGDGRDDRWFQASRRFHGVRAPADH